MRTFSSLLLAFILIGCGGSGDGPARPDLGSDATLGDASPGDGGSSDSGPVDVDAGMPVDAGPCATLSLAHVVSGLNGPSCAIAPPGDDRLFVCERPSGRVRIVDATGALTTAPFLDVSSEFSAAGYEVGVLSLAFHRDYGTHPLVYVSYTTTTNLRIASFAAPSATASAVDPTSEHVILEIPLMTGMHQHTSGALAFGADGFLYVSIGDMGSLTVSQDLNDLRGKILRLDVDATGVPYAIPPGNPFIGMPMHREEIWASGFREPYRFSFDSTGDLYVGEVGDSRFEEVDVLPAGGGTAGENFGWPLTEGNGHCHTPSSGCATAGLTPPVYEYAHVATGNAIMGGYVYRGTALATCWQGRYFFGDDVQGFLRSFVWDMAGAVTDVRDHDELRPTPAIVSLGMDGHGEILVVSDQPPATGRGSIARIAPP